MGLGKVHVAAIATTVAVPGFAYLFAWLGWIAPLQPQTWLVLFVTVVGLLVKSFIGDYAADGDFRFDKFGYDNCTLALGAVLTAFALQIQSTNDLFPGMSSVPVLSALPLPGDLAAQRKVHLFVFFGLAIVAALVTASVSRNVKKAKASDRGLSTFVNSIIGVGMLGAYVLILVTKG